MLIRERIEDRSFDPQLVEVTRLAFQKACDVLQLKCGPDDAITDLVATQIIELAKAGEADPDLLCSQVLIEMAEMLASAGT
jgi:hypothetical protein